MGFFENNMRNNRRNSRNASMYGAGRTKPTSNVGRRPMPNANRGFKFQNFSCELGDKVAAKYSYDCRIMNHHTGQQDRVLVYASNFGEVKWCIMGYTRECLIITDTSIKTTKHLVRPDDVGEQNYVVIVVRNR